MAPTFAHGTTRPISYTTIIALVFFVLVSTLVSVAIWLSFVQSRQHRLQVPASATQIHVQVEVEKSPDSTSGRAVARSRSRSSVLPFLVAASRPPSTPNSWLRTLMHKLQRRSFDAAITVPSPSYPTDSKYTELPRSPRHSQASVKREMWFAFETDASLATFDNDPLAVDGSRRDQFFLPPFGDDCGSSSMVSTPALVSGMSSPASTWNLQTPPPLSPTILAGCPPVQAVTLPDCVRLLSTVGSAREPSPVGIKGPTRDVLKNLETGSADQRPTCTEGFPSPSNFVARDFDAPPSCSPDSLFPSDIGTDRGVKADDDTRYAALISAFSASFSASSQGLSGSDRDSDSQNDSVHFHDHGPARGVVCVPSFSDKTNSDGLRIYDDDHERDIGTVALQRSCPLAGGSFLAM